MGISYNPVLRAFKGLFLSSPTPTVPLRLGGPQPALGTPSANLIGCSFVPEHDNWYARETAKYPHRSTQIQRISGFFGDECVPARFAASHPRVRNCPRGSIGFQRIAAISGGDCILSNCTEVQDGTSRSREFRAFSLVITSSQNFLPVTKAAKVPKSPKESPRIGVISGREYVLSNYTEVHGVPENSGLFQW